MADGLVFSIVEFSTFDGPGIRSTVFLQGCPLRCQWCHNPEGQSFSDRILRSPNGCSHCGNCEKYAFSPGVYSEKSLRNCPNGLLRHCAALYSPQALADKLAKNFGLLGPDGGVTFSGGEPLSQPEFLLECLTLLRGKTDRAIQTSGFAPADVFNAAASETDRFLFDIKLLDDTLHRHYTGVSNRPILQNFRCLAASGKDFTVRTPLIPGVTDTPENLSAIAALLSECYVNYIELLPYNSMAGSKYPLAGMRYAPDFDTTAPVQPHTEIFADAGITAQII